MRTITNYYNVYKQQWVTGDGTPLLERNWPILNLWETPTLGIHILEDEMQNIVIPEGATFTIAFTDAYDNTIAAPVEGTVNNEEYYEDANPELGIFSFMTALDSQEAYDLVQKFRIEKLYLNLAISSDSTAITIWAPYYLHRVVKPNAIPLPLARNTQYRLNPIDSGTDIWDYGFNRWMRPVLENGVLNYYEAP